jgi:hypothetical protein
LNHVHLTQHVTSTKKSKNHLGLVTRVKRSLFLGIFIGQRCPKDRQALAGQFHHDFNAPKRTPILSSPFVNHPPGDFDDSTTATMADNETPVTLRTRKFIRNPLLGRKQMVV